MTDGIPAGEFTGTAHVTLTVPTQPALRAAPSPPATTATYWRISKTPRWRG